MFFIASVCACCLTGMIDRFITLAFGEGLLIGRFSVYVLIFNLYMTTVEIPVWSMMTASGLFQYDKWVSVLGSVVNLVISFVFGKKYGMPGILAGTSATYIIQFVLKSIFFHTKYLKLSAVKMLVSNGALILLTAVECAAVTFVCERINMINGYVSFLLCVCVSVAIPLAVNSLLFFRTDEFRYAFLTIKRFAQSAINRFKR